MDRAGVTMEYADVIQDTKIQNVALKPPLYQL